MLARISTSLVATLLLSSTTLAAPTQTHCRCEIVADMPSSSVPASAAYTPSAAHWSPADPSQSPVAALNVCASLGSELQKLQHTEPELYDSYMAGAIKDAPQKPNNSSPEPVSEKSSLRLTGAERRLLAIPTGPQEADSVFSPGAEKKLRAYETTRYFVTQASSGRREFIAYDDDSDDEANRPVM
ncbi:hypothetical protein J4E86_009306 [Alternaria arbusti]|uniref:uncharacterized protein n=1 Tax=Alternaria arbusti TaxID=232088 RepID=UPI0022202E64|nr:uncharacterized protein J4E86_009306 [Alternaria arbusti]KAI4945419.1 hypothetical protein J4E86_009306 [Alternaria arbusti]